MFEYIGAVHIHSIYSDGSGEVPEIASIADEVGLDFILLTDHNTLRALDENYEGWYGRTLLLAGCELNDKENKNHYLAFGIDETYSTRKPAKEYVQNVKDSGGIGFIAHPHEKRSSMKEHPPYPWVDWDIDGFTGIEIWNHMSEWMEGLTEENKYNYFVHPLRSIEKPQEVTLKVWDDLSLKRKVVGIGGVDAHAHKVNLLGFFEVEVFPYKVLFKSIRTHILTDEKIPKAKRELKRTRKIVYSTLESGRCFVSNYYLGDAKGFRFWAELGGEIFQMGESIELQDGIRLFVNVPQSDATIKVIRNGEVLDSVENAELKFQVDSSGAYRIEVYIDERPWIYSNHIRIGL